MSAVSVIVPTWNRAGMVDAAIRSALAQTLAPREILVCDDGSTDETEARVRNIGDERVRWVPGPHKGVPAAPRNRGIAVAKGEWLAFLDSDDTWVPEKLELQLKAVGATGCGAVCSDAHRVIAGKRHGALLSGESKILEFTDMIKVNGVVCSSALVHRSFFPIIEGFPETPSLRVGEDYALWLRVASLGPIQYLATPLVNYRDEPADSVRGTGKDALSQRIAVLDDFVSWCGRHPGDATQVARRIAQASRRETRMKRFVARLRNVVRKLRG